LRESERGGRGGRGEREREGEREEKREREKERERARGKVNMRERKRESSTEQAALEGDILKKFSKDSSIVISHKQIEYCADF